MKQDMAAISFDALSLQEGTHCHGTTPSGERVVCRVVSVSWWLTWVLLLAGGVPPLRRFANAAVQRGLELEVIWKEGVNIQ